MKPEMYTIIKNSLTALSIAAMLTVIITACGGGAYTAPDNGNTAADSSSQSDSVLAGSIPEYHYPDSTGPQSEELQGDMTDDAVTSENQGINDDEEEQDTAGTDEETLPEESVPDEPGETVPEETAAEIFRDDFDGPVLDTSVWQAATWIEHGGQTGSERCYVEDGYLHMIFRNDSESGYLNASVQTRDEFLYGTWKARLKPSSTAGVLNSMFTIDWDDMDNSSSTSDGTKQEIDIEFLTASFSENAGEVHYAVHAEGKNSHNTNPDIPVNFNPSDDFHIWGFTITPEKIEWFVDETVLHSYVYSENDIAVTGSYQLKFNVWTCVDWVNGPPEADVDCVYLIDWVSFTPL